MHQNVTLTIDGAAVRVHKGSSVLDAALQAAVCIPHLCHMPNLDDIGACRICVVEHIRNGRSKITTSCTLIAREGMVIDANSERVQMLRRNIAELLVTQAPNSKAIQDLAVRCGVTEARYSFRNDDCVLCGRCVRACTEFKDARAIGFVGRGRERRVRFPYDERPESCSLCRECVMLCPMSVTPCDGSMHDKDGYLCGKCESTVNSPQYPVGVCNRCDMGEGFDCARHFG